MGGSENVTTVTTVAVKEGKNLPAVFRTAEIVQLQERFDNVINLIDPADKLLMLDKIIQELWSFRQNEANFRNGSAPILEGFSIVLGCGAVVAVGGALAFGPLGVMLGFAGALLPGFPAAITREHLRHKKYERQYADIAVAESLLDRAGAAKREMLETADVHAMARSPRGVDVFTQFPALKDKFLLAVTVQKVLEAEDFALKGLLDKPSKKPPGSSIVL